MSLAVFLEHHEGELQKGALGVLGKAASLGGDVVGIVLGSGVKDLAAQAGKYGATKVLVADAPELEAPLPQPRVDALAQIVREHGVDTVLFAASVLASDVAGGLAARLDAGLNWDLVDIAAGGRQARRQAARAGGHGLRRRGVDERAAARALPAGHVRPGRVRRRSPGRRARAELRGLLDEATMIEQAHEEAEGPSIEDADVIVAGGRGLGGPENFSLVEALAKALGGAVAATRAVVDAGWYPYATQVGQTGKTVSPKLYVACGISGAIQHKVGMQGSGTVVAINKDPNAPIFEFCDLGVVGDLHEIVPKLTELVQQRKGA